MPHFFFHLIGTRPAEDTDGVTLMNDIEARNYARVVADELARNRGDEIKDQAIMIVDDSGREVFRVPLQERDPPGSYPSGHPV